MTDTANDIIRSAINRAMAELDEVGMKPFLTRMYPDGQLTIVLLGSTKEKPSFPIEVNSTIPTV